MFGSLIAEGGRTNVRTPLLPPRQNGAPGEAAAQGFHEDEAAFLDAAARHWHQRSRALVVRVHDVKATREALSVWMALTGGVVGEA